LSPIKKLGRDFIEARWRRLFHRPLQPPYSMRWIAAWGALVSVLFSVLSTRMHAESGSSGSEHSATMTQ